MEKRDNVQLDLFSPDALGRQDGGKAESPLFAYIRAYEKAVLVIIGLVVTGLVCFMLGMERGKRAVTAQFNQRLIEISRQQRSRADQPQKAAAALMPQREQAPAASTAAPAGNFTIQLASFKSRAYAEKEAGYLKKKGYSPALAKNGDYFVLCVGMFQNEEKAQPLLVEFKKRYSGCHIRRL